MPRSFRLTWPGEIAERSVLRFDRSANIRPRSGQRSDRPTVHRPVFTDWHGLYQSHVPLFGRAAIPVGSRRLDSRGILDSARRLGRSKYRLQQTPFRRRFLNIRTVWDTMHSISGTNFHDPNNPMNQNGVVFFPGSSPLYVLGILAGGLGVSGDGVDQDDVVTVRRPGRFRRPPEYSCRPVLRPRRAVAVSEV